jgi:hypothetical protein
MFVWPGLTEIYLCHAACSCQEMLRVRPGRQAGVGRWYCGRPMPGTAQQVLVAAYRSAKNVRAAQLEVALAEVGPPWPARLPVCLSVCLSACLSLHDHQTRRWVGWADDAGQQPPDQTDTPPLGLRLGGGADAPAATPPSPCVSARVGWMLRRLRRSDAGSRRTPPRRRVPRRPNCGGSSRPPGRRRCGSPRGRSRSMSGWVQGRCCLNGPTVKTGVERGGAGLISRWRADMGGALQVAGFNGLCGPFDGDQCPSCQRYQEQVLRESRPQAWREVREAFPCLCGPV